MNRPLMVAALIGALLGGETSRAQTLRAAQPAPPQRFLCRQAVDPGTGAVVSDAAIDVAGGRIVFFGPRGAAPAPAGAVTVDLGNRHVIPGLIDLHAHLYGGLTRSNATQAYIAPFLLAAGVTAARAPGSSDPDGDIAMRNRIDNGYIAGPRLFLAGEYLDMEPSSVSWIQPVRTPEEARRSIDHWVSRGAEAVKVYASMKGPILDAAIAQAHAHGVRVVGHLGATTWQTAIATGIDELAHGVMAFPEVFGGVIEPVTTMEAYAQLRERSATADLQSPAARQALAAAAAARVILTPTVVTSDLLPRDASHRSAQAPFYSPAASAEIEKRLAAPPADLDARLLSKQLEFVAAAHTAGARLATGTDVTPMTLLPGFSLWREIELFARAGLAPMDVLKAATANGAIALGREGQLGSLRPGAFADFVVLDGDPLADVSNVRRVYRVVKNGVVYTPDEIRKRWIGRID